MEHTTTQGYTSWYLHYNKISEEILHKNLKNAPATNWKIFQIDDGYQTQIGDWLSFQENFPQGIQTIAQKVLQAGLLPGIWCAPFVASKNSLLFKNNKDWFLKKNNTEEYIVCGNQPLWGGEFYALNTENEHVLNYVEEILKTMFINYGFKFLKADFLYAPSLQGFNGNSRAFMSAKAHLWLHSVCEKYGAIFLSCGAVLSSSYGRCHFARIGPDVGESWFNEEFARAPSREKVSTHATIQNTILRAVLDRVAFQNDPDVYMLRKENCSLTLPQKEFLLKINALYGSLIFCSDNVSSYELTEQNLLQELKAYIQKRKIMGEIESICVLEENSHHEFVDDFYLSCQHSSTYIKLSDHILSLKSK
jgi:alpha-galactosidase